MATTLPLGIPPPSAYLPTGSHLIPAQDVTLDTCTIPKPTDGDHVVQRYGPRVLVAENNLIAQPFFEYSRCCGNRKAVLVGINYIGTDNSLRGCINDVRNMQKFLIEHFDYTADKIVLLTDDNEDKNAKPTKANIVKAMKWLVDGATKDDALFFHYSGHGTQTKDRKLPISFEEPKVKERRLDERDKQDEAICPLDFQTSGLMVDDEVYDHLVQPLPAGCRLTAIFDSCNSGSVMDIPYVYQPTGQVKEPEIIAKANKGIFTTALSAIGNILEGDDGNDQAEMDLMKAQTIMNEARTSAADVVCWSGCRDDQTSADTFEDGQNVGAMSWAFITSLTKHPKVSYMKLLVSIRQLMKEGHYTQMPQLSACHPIDTDLEFVA